jgi:hypothetical protein
VAKKVNASAKRDTIVSILECIDVEETNITDMSVDTIQSFEISVTTPEEFGECQNVFAQVQNVRNIETQTERVGNIEIKMHAPKVMIYQLLRIKMHATRIMLGVLRIRMDVSKVFKCSWNLTAIGLSVKKTALNIQTNLS